MEYFIEFASILSKELKTLPIPTKAAADIYGL